MADLGTTANATTGQKRKLSEPTIDDHPRINYGLYWGQSLAQVTANIDPKWTMPPARIRHREYRAAQLGTIPHMRGRPSKATDTTKQSANARQPVSKRTSIDRDAITNKEPSKPLSQAN